MRVKDLRARLISEFRWRSDPAVWPEPTKQYADDSAWWRDPAILAGIGQGLADLFPDSFPTIVMGTESRGSLLGPLVACHLGIGFVEVRKEASEHLTMTSGSAGGPHRTTGIGTWICQCVVPSCATVTVSSSRTIGPRLVDRRLPANSSCMMPGRRGWVLP